jgi:hypothetical protein
MRLARRPTADRGSKVAGGSLTIEERHHNAMRRRHRNTAPSLRGFVFSGMSPDGKLPEIVECAIILVHRRAIPSN